MPAVESEDALIEAREYNDGKHGGHVFTCDQCGELYRGGRMRKGLCRLCKESQRKAALDPNRPAIVCCSHCNGLGAFYKMEPPYSPVPTPCPVCKGKSMYIVHAGHPQHPNFNRNSTFNPLDTHC